MTSLLRADTADALLRDVALVQARHRQPSVVAGVVRDGALAWSGSRGHVEGDAADVQYRIGSLTKMMTAVLALQCRDEGLLDLDSPVVAHLRESPWPDTSLRRLLAHAGGLPAEPEGPWWERHDDGPLDDLLTRIDQQPLAMAPGSRFHYSNVGYALLGAVVEKVRGGSWSDVLRERVLDPLGMGRTTYGPAAPHAQGWSVHPWSGRPAPEPHTDTGAMAPAGQLWSTIGDLARWAAFWLDPDPAVLDPGTAEEMRVPAAAQVGDPAGGAYGLGLSVIQAEGGLRFGHGGSMPGFVAGIVIDVEERSAAATLANATVGGGGLAVTLLDTLRRCEPALPQVWTAEPELPGADELLGQWYWGNSPYTAAVRGGMLRVETDNAHRCSRYIPDGPDQWRGLDGYFTGEQLRVVRDATGAVDHLDLATYELRREPYA